MIAEMLRERAAPAIVDITGISFADEEARQIFAGLSSAATEVATAILVRSGSGAVPAVLSYSFAKLESDRPIAFFDREHDAVAWARRFARSVPSE